MFNEYKMLKLMCVPTSKVYYWFHFFYTLFWLLAFNQFGPSIYNCLNFTSATHSTRPHNWRETYTHTHTNTMNLFNFLFNLFIRFHFCRVIGLLFSITLKSFRSRVWMEKFCTLMVCRLFPWTTRQRESERAKKKKKIQQQQLEKLRWTLRYWLSSS